MLLSGLPSLLFFSAASRNPITCSFLSDRRDHFAPFFQDFSTSPGLLVTYPPPFASTFSAESFCTFIKSILTENVCRSPPPSPDVRRTLKSSASLTYSGPPLREEADLPMSFPGESTLSGPTESHFFFHCYFLSGFSRQLACPPKSTPPF